MIYGVTADGFVRKTFEDILESVEDDQTENLNAGMTRDRLSVIGTINTGNIQEISELWEVAEETYNAQNPNTASDFSLEVIAALTGTEKTSYSKTRVSGRVEMNPNKALPAGSVANLTGDSDTRFVTLTEVPANESGGYFTVVFEAEEYGSITVSVGQLSEISEAQEGWVGVTNLTPGITGDSPETDAELRLKRELELAAKGSTNIDAIKARLIQDTDATNVNILQNETDVVNEFSIPPHRILPILDQGDSQEIADTLWDATAGGIATFGDESETVTDTSGTVHTMRWTYAETVAINVTFGVDFEDSYDTAELQDAVIAQVISDVTDFLNDFDIGEDVLSDAILCVIRSVPGVYDVTTLYPSGDTTINYNQRAIAGDIEEYVPS